MQVVWQFISGNYLTLVDTLLVATLFYYAFLSVRGTKAATVLQVLAILGVVYFLCQYLKLITLVFIVEKILVIGPIALFIIFAPEIRKILERAGKRSRLAGWISETEPSVADEEVVDLISEVALDLAKVRTGALIVFEGEEHVDEYVVPGTLLDAAPSQRLLQNLFDRNNSLHDGAVIIRDQRIHSAGNFLPISESALLDAELGTRHRAALGLTERSSAVAVVVSEERGTVSIAFHGRLARDLTPGQFNDQLWALIEHNENYSTPVPQAGVA